MQHDDVQRKTLQFVKKMPYIKGIILSELNEDVEVYSYLDKDIDFKIKQPKSDEQHYDEKKQKFESFFISLLGGSNTLYNDNKEQFNKLGDISDFKIAVMYDQYFVKKVQIGKNILMIVIADTKADSLDIGQIDMLIEDYRTNFAEVDNFIEDMVE